MNFPSKTICCTIAQLLVNISLCQNNFEYPQIARGKDADTLHNVIVSDPYRSLENLEYTSTKEWLSEQDEILRKYDRSLVLKQQLELQAKLVGRARFKFTEGFEKQDYLEEEEKYTFTLWSNRIDQVKDIYYKTKGLEGYSKLLDVSRFKRDKSDNVLVRGLKLNEEEDKVAIALSHSGSDWKEIFVYDIDEKRQLNDTVTGTLGRLFWANDGFYYTGYKQPDNEFSPRTHQVLKYHQLGTSQSEDLVLFTNPDTTSSNQFNFSKLNDDQYVLNYKHKRGEKIVNVSSLVTPTDDPANFFLENFLSLPPNIEYSLDPEVVIGDSIFMKADINSPNFKIVICDKSKVNAIKQFVPEFKDKLISINNLGDKHLACFYSLEGSNSILIYDLNGALVKRISFPKGNKVFGLQADVGDEYAYYLVVSYHRPPLYFRLNLKTWDSQRVMDMELPYDPEVYESRYVHFPSKDGTMIPMHIVCRKDIKLNSKNPTLIYGYGGYGVTQEPNFKVENILWLENGGVLAFPNIRGGGAEGSDWAKEGRGLNKQNTIDDFIGAADYLVSTEYTNANKLACMGASHGGFVVNASIVQRPKLFRAAISMAGPSDMIRKSLYSSGASDLNLDEYGDPNEEEEFKNLFSFSPYHNITKGVRYPQTLLITGDSDNRVPPFHSYKFLAELQSKGDNRSLTLLKVVEGAGHDFTITNQGYYEDIAFRLHFLFDQLDIQIRNW